MARFLNLYLTPFRGLPRDVWLLSAVLFVNRSGAMALTFLPLYLTQGLGFDLKFAGMAMSIYGFGHLCGAILGGWLCDRMGPTRIQRLSLALSGLGYAALGLVSQPFAILALTFLVAVLSEAFRPANGAAIAAASPPELRTRAVALNRLAINLGFSFGPAIGGWLASIDYAWLFWVDAATCLVAAGLLHLFCRLGQISGGRPGAEDDQGEAGGAHPLRDFPFLIFLALTVPATVIFFQGWTAYPIYLKEVYGLSEAYFGLLMASNGVAILLFEMLVTHYAERFRPLAVTGFGAFLFALGMAALPFGRGFAYAFVLGFVWTVGEMLFAPAAGGWVARRAGAAHRGMYMGLYTLAWGVGFTIAPMGGAWIYEHWGPQALWFLCGGLGALNWLGYVALERYLERRRRLQGDVEILA